MRVAMEVERGRLAHTTELEAPQRESGGSSVVRSWAELRAKHQEEREALQRKFRTEHDWCVVCCVFVYAFVGEWTTSAFLCVY